MSDTELLQKIVSELHEMKCGMQEMKTEIQGMKTEFNQRFDRLEEKVTRIQLMLENDVTIMKRELQLK